MKDYINIIGGGLAGAEAAYQVAKRGIRVRLYEVKPNNYSPAHINQNLAEIVCSNSFKSNLLTNACGLLKEELRLLDSLLIKMADETRVPAGQALAVDRDEFSKKVTKQLEDNDLIQIVRKEVKSKYDDSLVKEDNEIYLEDLIEETITIIATGPLTLSSLAIGIKRLTGKEELHFYDAAAPIIEKDSIDFNIAFYGDRYSQEKKKDETKEEWIKRQNESNSDYINLPMNKDEYEKFVENLIDAEIATLHEFEKKEIFEGCMPLEIMAKRGQDTLRFGPLKPVGFTDLRTRKKTICSSSAKTRQ